MSTAITYIRAFILVLFLWTSLNGMAQTTADSETLEKLRKDMYYHFSKINNKEFIETVEALKKVAKALKNEKDYYKAYGNQAIYTSTNISRGEGIDIAKAIYKQAEQEKSYYGLFTANFVFGTIYTAMAQLDEARLRYQDAIEILKQHFPEESTPCRTDA